MIQFNADSGDASQGCRQFCKDDPHCTAFAVYPDEISENAVTTGCTTIECARARGSVRSSKCYLLDRNMHALTEAIPEAFDRPGRQNGTSGLHTSRMYKNPFVTDSNVFTHTPQHFVRGCEYTIALWVWLYKPHTLPDSELVIYSTREAMAQPRMYHDEALLPAIIYNVGGLPDRINKFFFSAAKDNFGSYHGFWANHEVRFHEWTHLTMAVSADILIAYINGEQAGMVSLSHPRQEALYCPYNRAPPSAHTHTSSLSTLATDAVLQLAPYSFAPFHPSDAINNTILQVAGSNQHNVVSTPGLFLDLTIVRNAMLSHEQVSMLMRQREPPRMAHLQALMRAYGKFSLEGFSPVEYRGWHNAYLQLSWGMCPEVVCGPVDLSEALRLGPNRGQPYRDVKRAKESIRVLSAVSMERAGAANEAGGGGGSGSAGVMSDEEVDAFYSGAPDDGYYSYEDYLEYEAAVDSYYGASAAPDDYADDYGYDGVRGEVGPEREGGPEPRGGAAGGPVGGPRTGPGAGAGPTRGNRAVRKQQHGNATGHERDRRNETVAPRWGQLFPTALRASPTELLQHGVRMSARRRNRLQRLGMPLSAFHNLDKPPAEASFSASAALWLSHSWAKVKEWALGLPGDEGGNGTARSTTNGTSGNTTITAPASSAADSESSTYLESVSELYNTALLWLQDRHDAFRQTAPQPMAEWKAVTLEKASGALMLALWLADEEKQAPNGWSLKSAPAISQPIHMALAFIAGFDALDDARVPADVGVFLASSLGGGALRDLLGLSRETRVDLAAFRELSGLDQSSLAPTSGRINDTHWMHGVASLAMFDEQGLSEAFKPLAAYILSLNTTDKAQHKAQLDAGKALLDMRLAQRLGYQDTAAVPYSKVAAALVSSLGSATGASEGSPTFSSPFGTKPHGGVYLETECLVAAGHYFPVAQFVAGHFGLVETGVGLLEDVRIASASESGFQGHQGEDDELQLHHEAEAEAGDAHAQMWLGRRAFWGYGGLQPNAAQARRWFERAAQQGDPEGLYNVGVFHNNGQAGLPVNPQIAMEYFMRAANAPVPFAMALHAVGQHYLRTEQNQQNLTLAREYFQKAAELSSADGHFSLAMMYRDGSAGEVNVPMCVVHLALAISLGHIRASNFLAHGLLDPESWFNLYAREQEAMARVNATLTKPAAVPLEEALFRTPPGHQQQDTAAEDQEDYSVNSLWKFNASLPIYINLPYGSVPLPVPLGSGGTCSVALHLLKNIAENSYRTNDLTREALASYLAGDLWTALDLYDEAAALGVQSAMENSAWIYDLLRETQCKGGGGDLRSKLPPLLQKLADAAESVWEAAAEAAASAAPSLSSHLSSAVSSLSALSARAAVTPWSTYLPAQPVDQCKYYFRKMTARRWIQLANTGDFVARREVAHRFLQGDTHGPIAANESASALLYALAAEQGDVHSLVNLAWMFLGSAGGSLPVNTTAARSLLKAAADAELAPESGHMLTTQGVASQITFAYLALLDWYIWLVQGTGQKCITASLEVVLNLVTLSDYAYSHRTLSERFEVYVFTFLLVMVVALWQVMQIRRQQRVARGEGQLA